MFAGKTTWLLRCVRELQPNSFQLFKPSMDTRYSDSECVTHTGDHWPALTLDVQKPRFPKLPAEITTLFIDELNFFQPHTLLPALRQQQKLGRSIIGVGLLYDSEKRPFGATLPLSELADEFHHLTAICDGCGKAAAHSYRKVTAESQVLLGAADLYGACCEACWERFSHAHSPQRDVALEH